MTAAAAAAAENRRPRRTDRGAGAWRMVRVLRAVVPGTGIIIIKL